MTTDGKVSTRDGARLYGISASGFLRAMKAGDARPEVRRIPDRNGRSAPSYWWNPSDILRVRAERKLAQLEAKQKLALMAKAGINRSPASRALAKQTCAENQRRKILKRVAAHKGVSVEQLVQEKGLQRYYREA
jgi:hypothetical protein